MNNEKKEEILAKIAKEHALILPNNDAIFAVIIANEVMFEDFITRIERSFEDHMKEIEGMTAKYIADAKELAEVKIGAAVTETYRVLDERHKLALKEIEIASKAAIDALAATQAQNKISNLLIALVAVAAVLIGFFVGKIF
jgi:hypothetical protein